MATAKMGSRALKENTRCLLPLHPTHGVTVYTTLEKIMIPRL